MTNSDKKLIEELRKYNKELEKHIPGLGDSSLNSNKIFKSEDDQDEVFTLFAQNLLDLRTEMNLIRKNLSTDIEGMVTRVVNDQQKKFNTRMDNFFVKAILDVKENWSSQLNTFSKEINEIKRGFNQMKSESSNVEDSILGLKEQFMILKSAIVTLSNREDSALSLVPQIKSLEDKVDKLRDEIDTDLDTNDLLNQKVNKLSNSYKAMLLKFNEIKLQTDTFDTELSEIRSKKTSRHLKNELEEEMNFKHEDLLSQLEDLKLIGNKDRLSPSLELPDFEKKEVDSIMDIKLNVEKKLDELKVLDENQNDYSKINKSPSQRIIDIESKISKLSSYK